MNLAILDDTAARRNVAARKYQLRQSGLKPLSRVATATNRRQPIDTAFRLLRIDSSHPARERLEFA